MLLESEFPIRIRRFPRHLGTAIVAVTVLLAPIAAAGAAGATAMKSAKPAAAVTANVKVIAAKGLGMSIPSAWTTISIDDPKLADALAKGSKANPQIQQLTPEKLKASGVVLFATDLPKNGFSDNINAQVIAGGPADLKGAEEQLKAPLESQGAVVGSQVHIKVSGLDAIRTEYTLPVNAVNGKKLTVYGTQIVTVKSKTAYIITISLGASNRDFVTSLAKSITVK